MAQRIKHSYEGPEDYLFISYSHKDEDKVLKVIERLQRDGYRVWYDEGIEPGAEWPESIARHLNDCAVFIPFISNTYMDSFNCRREIDFAVRKRKPMLSVMLEETQMPLGMEMQLSTVQSITYDHKLGNAFYEKIYNAGITASSRAGSEKAKAGDAPSTASPGSDANAGKAEEAGRREKVTAGKSRSAGGASARRRGGLVDRIREFFVTSGDHRGRGTSDGWHFTVRKNMIIVGAMLAVFIAFGIIVSRMMVVNIAGVQFTRNTNEVRFPEGTVITDRDLEKIGKLGYVTTLNLDDTVLRVTDKSSWGQLGSTIRYLSMDNCGLTDEDFKSIDENVFVNLLQLTVSDNPELTSIQVMEFLGWTLRLLDISNTGVKDISPLNGAHELSNLNMNGIAARDISILSNCESISSLQMRDMGIEDLGPAGPLTELELLDVSGNHLRNLDTLTNAVHLRILRAANNEIESIDGLENCTLLEEVDLTGNKVKNVDVLGKSRYSMKYLYLSGGNSVESLDALFPMTSLRKLDINGNSITDLKGLEDSKDIYTVDAEHNRISVLPSFAGLSECRHLYLAYNEIEGQVDLTGLSSSLHASLQHNKITGIKLKGTEYEISAHANPLESLSVAMTDDYPYILCLSYSDYLKDWPKGTTLSSYLHVSGVPNDYITFMEDKHLATTLKFEADDVLDQFAEDFRLGEIEGEFSRY